MNGGSFASRMVTVSGGCRRQNVQSDLRGFEKNKRNFGWKWRALQHAAALLHSDRLVLGPRAERSRTQAAEQVESQDRRGQRSPQGQTGVRPGHNRPPSELTQPANQLAPAQSSGG
ncbi:hypothetical protein D4764_06G0004600 [Takifugu flavidus]|uniref:Uncharacterized protein n=1 Tax=Takifugu flavidus TaxID=433684 RepID=A0A5C6MZR6_9TELE|nr:hypothetical protein D4764_06G0004600 [Takifugu flavidus]